MTLAASGTLTLTGGAAPRDVATELGRPGTAVTIAGSSSDADLKTLIGYTSGSVVFPTEFYNKSAFTPYTDTLTTGAGNVTVPAGATNVVITVVGHGNVGGNSFNDSISLFFGGGGAGGGGGCSRSVALVPGDLGINFAYSVAANAGSNSAVTGSPASGAVSMTANPGVAGADATAGGDGAGGAGGASSGGTTNNSGATGSSGSGGGNAPGGAAGIVISTYGTGGDGGDPFGSGPSSGNGAVITFAWT